MLLFEKKSAKITFEQNGYTQNLSSGSKINQNFQDRFRNNLKRKLNLFETGYILGAWIGILFLVSGVFSLGQLLLKQPEFVKRLIFYCKWISLAAGSLLLALLLALIVIEAVQDSTYDSWYRKNQRRKLPAPGGYYECQYCGSRRVRPDDQQCPVCGKTLGLN